MQRTSMRGTIASVRGPAQRSGWQQQLGHSRVPARTPGSSSLPEPGSSVPLGPAAWEKPGQSPLWHKVPEDLGTGLGGPRGVRTPIAAGCPCPAQPRPLLAEAAGPGGVAGGDPGTLKRGAVGGMSSPAPALALRRSSLECSLKSHRALAHHEVPIPAPAAPRRWARRRGVAAPAAPVPSGDSRGTQQVTDTPGGCLGCRVGIPMWAGGSPGQTPSTWQHPEAARTQPGLGGSPRPVAMMRHILKAVTGTR